MFAITQTSTGERIIDIKYDYDDPDCQELSISSIQVNFLNQLIIPLLQSSSIIKELNCSLLNMGSVPEEYELVFRFLLKQLIEAINVLNSTCKPTQLYLDFSSSEEVHFLDDLIFELIEVIPNKDSISTLHLNFHNLVKENDSILTKDFFSPFSSLRALYLNVNYMGCDITSFIQTHHYLTSIDLNFTGAPAPYPNVLNMLQNKHLHSLKYEIQADKYDDDEKILPQHIADDQIADYYQVLAECIQKHHALTVLHFNFGYAHHLQYKGIVLNDFLKTIAYSRSLIDLSIKVGIENSASNRRYNVIDNALLTEHFLKHASLEQLNIQINGEKLVKQMSQHTHTQHDLIQALIKPNEPLNKPTLRLEKYAYYIILNAFQLFSAPKSITRHSLDYIVKILSHALEHHQQIGFSYPRDIEEKVLTFMEPLDVLKMSMASNGFFYQKRLELSAPQAQISANEFNNNLS